METAVVNDVDSPKIHLDEQVVEQLIDTAGVMTALIERMSDTHDAQDEKLNHFRQDLAIVRDSLRGIARVLLEGNGDKPLISRVAVLEEKVASIEKRSNRRETGLMESRKGKYALATALVTGLLALAATIISAVS